MTGGSLIGKGVLALIVGSILSGAQPAGAFNSGQTLSGGAAPLTITGISLSGNTFTTGTAGTVGTATANMTSGSFTGTWSLRTSGVDHAGATCNNYGTNFAIVSGTGVLTNTTGAAAGANAGLCVVATQAGVVGSPFVQAETITGSGGTLTPHDVYLPTVGAGTWTVDGTFNSSSNYVEAIGGGSGGANDAAGGSGGAGGEWCRINNFVPGGGTVAFVVGAGGLGGPQGGPANGSNGGDTTWNATSLVAKGAVGGNGGTGGTGASCFDGGAAGGGLSAGNAGGGAGGPLGVGGQGGFNLSPNNNNTGGPGGGGNGGGSAGSIATGTTTGANGGNNHGGSGGGIGTASTGADGTVGGGGAGAGVSFFNAGAGAGGPGTEFPGGTHGSGGGGGATGRLDFNCPSPTDEHGGDGGLYGGGGGGTSYAGSIVSSCSRGGNAAPGLIHIHWCSGGSGC